MKSFGCEQASEKNDIQTIISESINQGFRVIYSHYTTQDHTVKLESYPTSCTQNTTYAQIIKFRIEQDEI